VSGNANRQSESAPRSATSGARDTSDNTLIRPAAAVPGPAPVEPAQRDSGGRPEQGAASAPVLTETRPAEAQAPAATRPAEAPPAKVSLLNRLGLAKKDEAKPATQAARLAPDTTPAPAPAPAPTEAPTTPVRDTADAVTKEREGDTAELPAVPAGAVAPAAAPAGAENVAPARPKAGVARRTRKARLRLSRLDPWSVMKTSFLFSIAAGIMLVVAVYVVWTVIGASSLFDSVNDIVKSVVSTPGDTTPFRIQEYINTQKVMGVTALLACVDVVIFTSLATLGSFLYNLAATMLGGLEITLAED
jgi:hypothetical protein